MAIYMYKTGVMLRGRVREIPYPGGHAGLSSALGHGKTALRKNRTKPTNKATNCFMRFVFFSPFCSRARKGECSKYSKNLIGIDADLKSN